ncbi:hypothetical protein D3C71_2084500 [compost metagenome]
MLTIRLILGRDIDQQFRVICGTGPHLYLSAAHSVKFSEAAYFGILDVVHGLPPSLRVDGFPHL